jgi:AhpD family alkylhydroperoxidase
VPSTFRIPKAAISGPLGAVVRAWTTRTYGQVPDGTYVYWHHRRVLRDVIGFERKVAKWHALDPHLASFAQIASAATIGCTWCMDFGYFLAHDEGLDESKVREVPRWRESDVFTPLERDVMEYAEAISHTPPDVTEELSARLLAQLGAPAMVELTAWIALANVYTRTNATLGIEAQGFSAACGLAPLAQPSGVASQV